MVLMIMTRMMTRMMKMTNGKQSLQWREVALQLDARLRKLHEEIGAQIVKNTFEYGLIQEDEDET